MSQPSETIWKGVLIEEAFENKEILKHVTVVRVDMERLEGETGTRILHFDKIEVPEEKIDTVMRLGKKHIGSAWYFHLVKGSVMKVIFQGKVFTAEKHEAEKIRDVRKYGISLGILEEQMQFE